jgi:hypothetical protein
MVDQTALEIRLALHRCGHDPLPLVGKACFLRKWETKTNIGADEIRLWSSVYPYATNTGTVTKFTPVLDIDILNEEAAKAAEEIVRRHIRDACGGVVLVRVGLPPKRAVPFRTTEPFKKIKVVLTAPGGGEEKVEFLGDGQMVAVAGTHPDTRQPYRWLGDELWKVPRAELPAVHEAEAAALVDEVVGVLCRDHGYRRAAPAPRHPPHNASLMPNSTGQNSTGGTAAIRGAWVGGGAGGARKSWLEGGPMITQAEWDAPKGLYFLARMLTRCPKDKRRVLAGMRELVEARVGRNEKLFNTAVLFREKLIPEGVVTEAGAEALLMLAARCNGYIRKDGVDEASGTVCSGLGLER